MKRTNVFFIATLLAAAPFVSVAANANDQEIKGLLQTISSLVSEIDSTLVSLRQSGAYTGMVAGATMGIPSSETIIDNTSSQTKKFGSWCASSVAGYYGTGSLYSCGQGPDIFQWIPAFQESGKYEVFMWWTSHPNRSATGLVQIAEEGGSVTIKRVNQQTNGGKWNSLGMYSFGPGTPTMTGGLVEVSDQFGMVAADAVKFVKVESAPVALKYSKLAVPTIVLFNGTNIAYRFAANNPNAGDLTLNNPAFNIHASGADVFDPVMYVYADSAFSLPAHSESIQGVFKDGGLVEFISQIPISIPSGSTRYFEVRLGVKNKTAGAFVSSYPTFTTLPTETLSSLGGTIALSTTVLSPNGGETWPVGSLQTIKWSSQNLPSSAYMSIQVFEKIDEFGPGGNQSYLGIVEVSKEHSTLNSGSVTWVVPSLPSFRDFYRTTGQFVVRISGCIPDLTASEGARCSPYDESDAPFTIASPTPPPTPSSDIIIDNGATGTSKTGSWCVSGTSGFYGTNSLYSCGLNTLETYRWSPALPGTAYDAYEVSMWWTQHQNRSANVPVKILANIGGVQIPNTVYVNQQANGGKWNSLGTFLLGAGSYVEVSDKNGQANADAVKFVKKTSQTLGSLSISLDSSSPGVRHAVSGSTDQLAAVFKFHAVNESIKLTKFGVSRGADAKPMDIVKYTLWDGATKVGEGVFEGTSSSNQATIAGDFVIPKDGDRLLTVKVDLAKIGVAEIGTPGSMITLSGNASLTAGVGQTSGSLITSNQSGELSPGGIILVKSYPTLTRLPVPSNTLANGTMTLYRFSASANAAGDVGLGKVTFQISSTTVATSSNFQLYGYADSGFSVQAYALNPLNTPNVSVKDNLARIYFNPVSQTPGVKEAIQIPAGTTRYFELRGLVSGAAIGSSIQVSLRGDNDFVSMSSLAEIDRVGYRTFAENDFIWSGNTFTTSSVSASDWMNGYAVPGLPSGGMSPQIFSR